MTKKNGRQQKLFSNGHSQNGTKQLSKAVAPEVLAIWQQRAHLLAQTPESETFGETLDLLVFRCGEAQYGLEVAFVSEIHPLPQITPVPRTPDFVIGIFSARGRLISIIDLQAFMGMPTTKLTDRSKIIVVTAKDGRYHTTMEIGILADEVSDVTAILQEELLLPLTAGYGRQTEFASGITADMMVVLDLNALFSDKQLIIQEEVSI